MLNFLWGAYKVALAIDWNPLKALIFTVPFSLLLLKDLQNTQQVIEFIILRHDWTSEWLCILLNRMWIFFKGRSFLFQRSKLTSTNYCCSWELKIRVFLKSELARSLQFWKILRIAIESIEVHRSTEVIVG